MPWELSEKDISDVEQLIQNALGSRWKSIPPNSSPLWIARTHRRSCNLWTLLTFQKGYHGKILNVQVQGIDKKRHYIKMQFGIPSASYRPYHKGSIDEMTYFLQYLNMTYF